MNNLTLRKSIQHLDDLLKSTTLEGILYNIEEDWIKFQNNISLA